LASSLNRLTAVVPPRLAMNNLRSSSMALLPTARPRGRALRANSTRRSLGIRELLRGPGGAGGPPPARGQA
jgi:hypothetical protein